MEFGSCFLLEKASISGSLKELRMREVIVEKLWGQERILHNDRGYCMKELTINPGFKSSMHKHIVKEETFFVVAGIATIEFDDVVVELPPGNHVTIKPGRWHRFWTKSPKCIVVEASTEHYDDDVVRREPSKPMMEYLNG